MARRPEPPPIDWSKVPASRITMVSCPCPGHTPRDRLSAARGVVIGCAISAVLWALAIGMVAGAAALIRAVAK